jgi:Putative transposase
MIVPGGGISLDGTRWIGCRPKYLLPVKVLSRLFRPLMLEMLVAAHDAGRLQFFGDHAHLADKAAFRAYLAPLHRTKWFVYCKRPFAGPEQVLAYLARYTHRVAISNTCCASDQDRHLMMPPSLIHHRTETHHSGRLSTGGAPTCVDTPDWQAGIGEMQINVALDRRELGRPQQIPPPLCALIRGPARQRHEAAEIAQHMQHIVL